MIICSKFQIDFSTCYCVYIEIELGLHIKLISSELTVFASLPLDYFRFSVYTIMSSMTNKTSIFAFLFVFFFISFSCLVALVRVFSSS